MQVRTLSLTVAVPRETVFAFLADIENLPRWAPEFCERLALSRRGWFALTALGELFLELEADEHTGVIDLQAGEENERQLLLPLRVMAAPDGGTVVTVVFWQPPNQSDAQFETACELLTQELGRLGERLPRRAWYEEGKVGRLAGVGLSGR